VRDHDLFQTHVHAKTRQLICDIVFRSVLLQRAADTRADVLGEVAQLAIGVIVSQCGIADTDHPLAQIRGIRRACILRVSGFLREEKTGQQHNGEQQTSLSQHREQ
jgi:hypothetical protein